MKLFNKLTLIVSALAVVTLSSCSRPDKSRQILRDAGYTDIQITGWKPFNGSDSDTFTTGFKAKNSAGNTVTGVVTGGILKGYTIRMD